jgi:protein gp37
MAENSKIEWTHHTVNFWWGCTKVSPACVNCYAERTDARFNGQLASHWGPDAPRLIRIEAAIKEALRYERRAAKEGRRFRVFTNSMSDFFEDRSDLDKARRVALDTMRQTPHLDWIILTKRPEMVMEMLQRARHDAGISLGFPDWLDDWLEGKAPANVWLGTTVEDQARADRRIPALLQVPAAVRFLSCEPLLGAVDLFKVPRPDVAYFRAMGITGCISPKDEPDDFTWGMKQGIDWVICGGESGPNARPMHPDWARGLRDQCAAAGVPFFMKQMTKRAPIPEDLEIRQFPCGGEK